MIEFVKNFWCQKVLPLVYTDALSYYEMLGKFVDKLNELIGNVNNLNENTVFSVNNVKPVNGNVTLDASSFTGFVSGVNNKKPDSTGEVTLVAKDVGAIPDTTVVVSSVNGSTPDANGNVNLPQASGVTSVDGVGADAQGNVQLGAVRQVNGYSPDENGIISGVSANSMYSYISTWNTAKDIYDFAMNPENAKKIFYSGVWFQNDYPWWDASLFGEGQFVLTILNLAPTHTPLIKMISLSRGDIFVLYKDEDVSPATYTWKVNYASKTT